jgi:hypothetical protein
VFLGWLVDTQDVPLGTSRRLHKIPIFSDGIKSGLYLDMLVPTFPGERWGVARYASPCDMNTKHCTASRSAFLFYGINISTRSECRGK